MLTYDRKLFETIQPSKAFEPFEGFAKGIGQNISSWIFEFISCYSENDCL
jgi:hypothetical protein